MILVCGPSYSGKSRFISENGANLVSFPTDAEVEFLASFNSKKGAISKNSVLHYSVSFKDTGANANKNILDKINNQVNTNDITVVFLITPITELKERVFMGGRNDSRHSDRVEEIRHQLETSSSHAKAYLEAMAVFENRGYEIRYISSSLGEFQEIERGQVEALLRKEVTTTNTRFSASEITEKLENEAHRVYHRVELPYGLALKGQQIWNRFEYIFREDIADQSVLDIGCAFGGFSFEAERRGAIVTGCDINEERLVAARAMKEILNSGVKFELADYLYDSQYSDSRFDTVMALNVLHHVPNVEESLERLANLAKHKVILEFPTTADPLYSKDSPMKNLVGPTLIEMSNLFHSVNILPSPKSGRVFAICSKHEEREKSEKPSRIGIPRHERAIAA